MRTAGTNTAPILIFFGAARREAWARLPQMVLIGASIAGAALLRFDLEIPSAIGPSLWRWSFALTAAKLASFELFEIHRAS